MFEKKEEYRKAKKESKDKITKVIKVWSAREETLYDKGFQDGAKYGYNKANEWHFVSKEGHPNKDDIYLTIRKDGLHLGDYCQGGDGDIDCQSWCDYPSEEQIHDDSVIAWKEIVLLELPKEIDK